MPQAHLSGIIPHLTVVGAAKAVDFYKQVFGAEEVMRMNAPDGRITHTELKIGDGVIMLCDDFPEWAGGKSKSPLALGGSAVSIHVVSRDCDATVRAAVAAGATVIMPPADMFWGDRYAKFIDPFGHEWAVATHVKDMTPAEMKAAGEAFFKNMNKPK